MTGSGSSRRTPVPTHARVDRPLALKQGDAFIEQRRGCRVRVLEDGTCVYAPVGTSFYEDSPIVVDDEMVDAVMTYVEFVRKLALGGELHVEQRLSIEHMTGEDGAKGTTDAGIVFPDELCIIDAKFGFDRIMASYPLENELFEFAPQDAQVARLFSDEARMPNTQLTMYAEAMRKDLEFFHEFKRVLIAGLLPQQAGMIQSEFGEVYDLSFWKDESLRALKSRAESAEVTITFTSKIGHAAENAIKATNTEYRRCVGGMTSLRDMLTRMYVENDEPHPERRGGIARTA